MDIDTVVIGAGVVGLAVGRTLAMQGREVIVMERHDQIGEETSSRNSEVIHAGIYYPKGSLKAKLCVRGRDLLYDYCDSHNVDYKRLGKLIVASDNSQCDALEQIYQKALANGVDDVHYVEEAELKKIEPALRAVRAIRSPSTGIIDTHSLMLAYQGDLEAHGGVVALGSPLVGGRTIEGGFELNVGGEEPSTLRCREVINCGGLGAQQVAQMIEGIPPASIPQQYLSRGCYFTLAGRAPFSHLIYPLPNNAGLGVHLTIDMGGQARFGPDTEWVDAVDYTVDPSRGDAFYDSVRAYYPDLPDGSLMPGYSGIRPKISGPNETAADFMIQGPETHGITGWVALYGIESPGLTSSLAIAEYVTRLLETRA